MLEEVTEFCGRSRFHEGIARMPQEKLACLLAVKRPSNARKSQRGRAEALHRGLRDVGLKELVGTVRAEDGGRLFISENERISN